ncbi:MAG: radical SAM protein [Deltaproteobacteria bacterium]|nr:MAG: radical SAM protein [Deltaproteobacteria bacterium]
MVGDVDPPTGRDPGRAARALPRPTTLPASMVLTVTRACNLRCAYCPTAKDGWPSLDVDQARRAVTLFADRYCDAGRPGDVKLFGGEPLLVPDVVRAAIEAAVARPEIRRVTLSTNGLGLDADWLELVARNPKLVLTVSMDGRPRDHRRLRRALPGVADSYDHLHSLLPALRRTPRVVVTQTIAPSAARHAAANFHHLLELGFSRFNFLPGYFLPWRPDQLASLREGLSHIADEVRARWAAGRRLYVRNLFTWAPTPFFNTGLVVDSDGSIHPSNVGLSGQLDGLRGRTRVGSLDAPPSVARLRQRAAAINAMLAETLEPRVWESTLAADAALTGFVRGLVPAWIAARRRRRRRGS